MHKGICTSRYCDILWWWGVCEIDLQMSMNFLSYLLVDWLDDDDDLVFF
jgi:hypothetical protein